MEQILTSQQLAEGWPSLYVLVLVLAANDGALAGMTSPAKHPDCGTAAMLNALNTEADKFTVDQVINATVYGDTTLLSENLVDFITNWVNI